MGIPLAQQAKVAAYVVKQKLAGRKRFPLVLMLEPLFRCNLACAGCGKIDYPDEILNKRLSVADCLGAAEECGAPVVAIAGGREHTVRNESAADASAFVVFAPGSQMERFVRAAGELGGDGPPGVEQVLALAAAHGITMTRPLEEVA